MHKNAYGLNIDQRNCIVKMAKSNLYYEAYIAEQFNISIIDVRKICAKIGNYVCQKVQDNKHINGYKL